jgi:hypothetical protein
MSESAVIALLGAKALWLTYGWLASAIVASYLSARKGYGERWGLAAGLLLTVAGVLIWLLFPAKPDSRWKLQGPLPFARKTDKTVAQARAELHAKEEQEQG